jgi:hypothetical protein
MQIATRHTDWNMTGYKAPDFNQRAAAARAAKERALEKLRAKPAPDPAIVAQRIAAEAARDAIAAEKRAARHAALAEEKEAARAAAAAHRAAAEAAAAASVTPTLSEAEKKAARDARYAARKARKK